MWPLYLCRINASCFMATFSMQKTFPAPTHCIPCLLHLTSSMPGNFVAYTHASLPSWLPFLLPVPFFFLLLLSTTSCAAHRACLRGRRIALRTTRLTRCKRADTCDPTLHHAWHARLLLRGALMARTLTTSITPAAIMLRVITDACRLAARICGSLHARLGRHSIASYLPTLHRTTRCRFLPLMSGRTAHRLPGEHAVGVATFRDNMVVRW